MNYIITIIKKFICVNCSKVKNISEQSAVGLYIADYADFEIKEKIHIHKVFLKSIYDGENERLNLIENKTSQLLSHTTIIFSLFSLPITFFLGKSSEYHIHVIAIIVLVLLLLIAAKFYILAVYYAIKNYDIKKFIYRFPSPNNVITNKGDSIKFIEEEINDLIYCILYNIETDNKKGANLNKSHKYFTKAFIFSVILMLFTVFVFLFSNTKKNLVYIENPIEVQKIDVPLSELSESINKINDLNIIMSKVSNSLVNIDGIFETKNGVSNKEF